MTTDTIRAGQAYPFELYQGAPRTLNLEFLDANGEPVDLTGLSAKLQLRTSASSATVVHEASTTNGGIVLGGALGTATVNFPYASTAAIAAGTYVYDLHVYGTNYSEYPMYGTVRVIARVTT